MNGNILIIPDTPDYYAVSSTSGLSGYPYEEVTRAPAGEPEETAEATPFLGGEVIPNVWDVVKAHAGRLAQAAETLSNAGNN